MKPQLQIRFSGWKKLPGRFGQTLSMWFVLDHNAHRLDMELPDDATVEQKTEAARHMERQLLREFMSLVDIKLVDNDK